jgi:hypothetical protein
VHNAANYFMRERTNAPGWIAFRPAWHSGSVLPIGPNCEGHNKRSALRRMEADSWISLRCMQATFRGCRGIKA